MDITRNKGKKNAWPILPGLVLVTLAATNYTCEMIIVAISRLDGVATMPSDAFLLGHMIAGGIGLVWMAVCVIRNSRMTGVGELKD